MAAAHPAAITGEMHDGHPIGRARCWRMIYLDPGIVARAQAGFADQSHLTRVFARQFGCSPAVFERAASVAWKASLPNFS